MKILSIHDGHNSSVAFLVDGKIKYAIQEERLLNKKNAGGFPKKSIKKILELEKIKLKEIDYVVFSSKLMNPVPDRSYTLNSYNKQRKLIHKIKDFLVFDLLPKPFFNLLYNYKLKENQNNRIKNLLKLGKYPEKKILFTDHHLSHAASAYYSSHFNNEKALILTLDGGGDKLCASVNIGYNGKISRISKTNSGNSIGNIYSRFTYMMGMVPLEHEYKLMGLAPYSSKEMTLKALNVFKKYLSLNKKDTLKFKRHLLNRTFLSYSRIRKDTELMRFDQIAAGLQVFTEDLVVSWVKEAIKKTGIKKIALAGGVFMNVKVNKRIMELLEVEDLFVMPSSGDESLPIGASQLVYFQKTQKIPSSIKDIYWGPEFSEKEILTELKKVKEIKYKKYKNINSTMGSLLAEDKIVARCSGKMEFGARALGNRSILCNAANLDNVRIINMMIKNRDFWMPFAPVILDYRAKDYIKNPKNIKAPYMILTFDTTEKYTEMIGGVQQSDLTARPQIIFKDYNRDYYEILKEFEKKTSRGVLMNTSFNLHGFPLVYGPKEALWVFKNSGLEYLQLGDYLVEKIRF